MGVWLADLAQVLALNRLAATRGWSARFPEEVLRRVLDPRSRGILIPRMVGTSNDHYRCLFSMKENGKNVLVSTFMDIEKPFFSEERKARDNLLERLVLMLVEAQGQVDLASLVREGE